MDAPAKRHTNRGGGRTPREQEMASRAKSMAAAKHALETGTSLSAAAIQFGVKRVTTGECHLILTHGTPEEIAGAQSGQLGIGTVGDAIRARTTLEERKQTRKKSKPTIELIDGRKMDAMIWDKMRGAINALTAMPLPVDVVRTIRRNPHRIDLVDRKLIAAFTWLTDFSDAWTK